MSRAILIDGGYSTELAKHIKESIDGHPLWTSRFLVTNREACITTHRAFLQAGCEIIRTNTYQAYEEGFVKHLGLKPEEALNPIYDAVEMCRIAKTLENVPEAKIGGSVGPIGAWRGDGSEYTGSYCNDVSRDEFIEKHRPRMQALVKAGVDLLCLETIPCVSEALALVHLLREFPNTKAWLSFSARNSKEISNGDNFAEKAAECWRAGRDQLLALGVNCLDPSYVTPLFDNLKKIDPKIPFVAYPNSGEVYDTKLGEWMATKNVKKVHDYVGEWLDMGILYLGGCCRNSANEIAVIGKTKKEWEIKRNAMKILI